MKTCKTCTQQFEGEHWQALCKPCYAKSKAPKETIVMKAETPINTGDKFMPSYTKDIFCALVTSGYASEMKIEEVMKDAKALAEMLY